MQKLLKIICLFLSFLMLCSCNSYDTPTQAEFEEHSKKQGVVLVTDKTQYSYPEDNIYYTAVNYSEGTFLFRKADTELQIYANGKWEDAHFNEYITYDYWYQELGISEQSASHGFSLKEHEKRRKIKGEGYNRKQLKKGYYRIAREDCVSNIFFIS